MFNIWVTNHSSSCVTRGSTDPATCDGVFLLLEGKDSHLRSFLLGLLEKRQACGGEMRHTEKPTEEMMGNKLVLPRRHTENSPVSFTACEREGKMSKGTK